MMTSPRIYYPAQSGVWLPNLRLVLSGSPARHMQVLRLQPTSTITLFNGWGGQWQAAIVRIGRQEVEVELMAHQAIERELPFAMALAVVMPANDRMDNLVEKATELGLASLQPLMSERSVLRLSGERAAKKVAHWQAVAQAACEQCGRNRVPLVHPVMALSDWLQQTRQRVAATRWILSTHPECITLGQRLGLHGIQPGAAGMLPEYECLSGPEGGFSAAETQAAVDAGFLPTSLGDRILRADTAPLTALAALSVMDFSALNAQKLIPKTRP